MFDKHFTENNFKKIYSKYNLFFKRNLQYFFKNMLRNK